MVVRCGKCPTCRENYAAVWAGRIALEHRVNPNAKFITLTYSDFNLPWTQQGYMTFNKRHVQLFLKRVRKHIPLRYYISGEYAPDTGRPHYHGIYFFPVDVTLYKIKRIFNFMWPYSEIDVDIRPVEPKDYYYVTKYLVKSLQGHERIEHIKRTGQTLEFALCSKRPYLGYCPDSRLHNLFKDNCIYSSTGVYPIHTIYKRTYKARFEDLYERWKKKLEVEKIENQEKDYVSPDEFAEQYRAHVARKRWRDILRKRR